MASSEQEKVVKENLLKSLRIDPKRQDKYCWMDLATRGRFLGRLIISLYWDTHPYTSENFLRLCTGEYETPAGLPLHYNGSIFHRIVKEDGIIVGGDIKNYNGTCKFYL